MPYLRVRKGTLEEYCLNCLYNGFVPENGCVCFIVNKNPKKNYYIIGDGEHTFIELARPSIFFLWYIKLKTFFKRKETKNES